jgi:CheY-like chemotaxis protein
VLTAEDGLQAMKLAMSSAIDVVVTDAIMPNLSGQQLAAFLRNNPKLSSIPIVLLTGQENKTASATGAVMIDAFLYKPVKADDLKKCIGKLVKSPRA